MLQREIYTLVLLCAQEFNPESITGNGSGLLVALSDGAVVFARPIPYKMGMGAPALLAAYRSRITTTVSGRREGPNSKAL